MLPWSSIPWNPATTAISLRLRLSNSFSPSMLRMLALENAESVRIRSRSPTDVPPYFWTMSAISEPAQERQRAATAARQRSDAHGDLGAANAGARRTGRVLRGLDEVQRHPAGDQRRPGDVQRGRARAERVSHQAAGQETQPGPTD